MTYEEYSRFDATGLADLVRHHEVNPAELTALARARLEIVNPKINAVIHQFDDTSDSRHLTTLSEQSFAGVPFLLKDLPDGAVSGAPLTMSCRCLRNNRSAHDSELVKRYRRMGLTFIGSTNTPELGLMGTTEPELHGPTRNPWNLAHSSGGSSGGAAAAVAAGIVPVAHANDGGGSIRIPASACGLFGLKPTRGRMPMGPEAAEVWNGFAVPHVISRSVRDSAAFLKHTQGPDSGAPYAAIDAKSIDRVTLVGDIPKLHIAMVTRSILGRDTHADCRESQADAAKLLTDIGHLVDEVDLPVDRERLRSAYLTVIAACTAENLHSISAYLGRPIRPVDVEPATWFMNQIGHALSAADLEIARTTIGQATRTFARFHETYDVIMTPTMAYPPAILGELMPKPIELLGLAVLRSLPIKSVLKRVLQDVAADMIEKTPNTMLFNMTGQPAMSVPLYWNADRLPIGTQFAGPLGSEAMLLRLAAQLEEARPWNGMRPIM